MKLLILSFVSLLGIITVAQLYYQNTINAQPVSYADPVSYLVPSSYATLSTSVESSGILLEIPFKSEVKTISEDKSTLLKNITQIDLKVKNGDMDQIKIEVVPLVLSESEDPLSALEAYILNYVGIIPKSNQRVFKLKNFDIAEITYRPFNDKGDIWNRIYTLVKAKNKSWVVTIGFFESPKSKNNNINNIYKTVIESLKESDTAITEANTVDLSKVKKSWIDEYRKNNSKFESKIK